MKARNYTSILPYVFMAWFFLLSTENFTC
jgi:hypothetical protein